MEPVLKWAGGKRQLLPAIQQIIIPNLLPETTFFDPFSGGGSVFLSLEHPHTVINDYNSELINVYKQIKIAPQKLIQYLEIHQLNHCEEYYYKIRSLDRDATFSKMSSVEKAARTIYLNRTCYNGLYRVNLNGEFNVPVGRYSNPDIIQKNKILNLSRYLKKNDVKILCGDFSKATETAKSDDFVYFDPPYDYETSGFTAYTPGSFSRNDLERLKNQCDTLISLGCHILVSNNDTTFVNKIFSDSCYSIFHIKAKRMINCNAQKRSNVDEVLVYGHK